MERFSLCARGTFVGISRVVDPKLDSAAGARPNFHTTQWGLVVAASTEGTAEARIALEELYRLYCYPVYAFIRRRGYGRQDAQDLTQDFFVHLLEKGTLGPGQLAAGQVPQLPSRRVGLFPSPCRRTRPRRQTRWRLPVGFFG